MESPENLFLVGPMGVGKTTVGSRLAKRLARRFVDSDREIERMTGATIPLIFEIEGEVGFRQRERDVIRELAADSEIVLATGGGAILTPENRALLKERGFVVYLRAHVGLLYARTIKDKNRPLLQTAEPAARLLELQRVREPLYREVADLIVDTGGMTVRQVVNHILKKFQRCPPTPIPHIPLP